MAVTRNPSRTNPQRQGGLVRPGIAAAHLPVVELDARTGYDFLISTCNEYGELGDILAEDRKWLEESRAIKAVVDEDECGSACLGFIQEIGRMLVGRPEIRTARDVVQAIDALSDQELTEIMAGELLEDAELGASLAARWMATQEAFRTSRPGSSRPTATLSSLDRSRIWLRQPGGSFTFCCLGTSRSKADARMLDRDVIARRADDIAGDPVGFIERATNGIRIVPEQRIRRIVMAPNYFGRPYNTLTKIGDVQLICYPIADSSLGSADRLTPPNSTIRLYRALGDESRLRILKLLAEGDRYLTEIANELELSKPTIKHHLASLRSAGLVTVTDQGNMTYYSLRHDRAEEAGVELRAYLAH